MKLVLNANEAALVRDFARLNLEADRYSALGAPYPVHSLYLDSAEFAVYHRRLDDGDTKYRIRRYGSETCVWLERKRRNGVSVDKRRERIALAELANVFEGAAPSGEFAASFAAKVRAENLQPKLLISYPRSAWALGTRARLTLDWSVEARRPNGSAWFDLACSSLAASAGVILELKYDAECPPLFQVLLELIGRQGASWSKYGHGVEAFELTSPRGVKGRVRSDETLRGDIAS